MKPIFLIGYMGSGKSTLGKALASRCEVRFIDLDDYIEERSGKTIKKIFATEGEAAFRDLERRMLVEVSGFDNVLVACGGGTPCFGDNMELMNEHGDFITRQLEMRMPHYSKAAEVFDSTLLEDENQIERKCEAFISQFNLPLKQK